MIKKGLFFLGITLFYFFQATAQRKFGLGVQLGLTESSALFWVWLFLFILLSLVAKVVSIGLWTWAWTPERINWLDLNYALRENIRALGSMLTYGLFFILPGFYRYLQLYWVIWISFLYPPYKDGAIEVQSFSTQLWSSGRKTVLGLVLIFDILGPLMIEALVGVDSYSSTVILDTFLYSFFLSILTFLGGYFSFRSFQVLLLKSSISL